MWDWIASNEIGIKYKNPKKCLGMLEKAQWCQNKKLKKIYVN